MAKKLKTEEISGELKRLIAHIKENKLNVQYDIAINYDGILELIDTAELCPGGDWSSNYDFGFDCSADSGSFYLFKQVPDDDPIEIMKQHGIIVGRQEDYADWADEYEEEEEDED